MLKYMIFIRSNLAWLLSLLILTFADGARAQNATDAHIYELLKAHEYAEAESAANNAMGALPEDCSLRAMLGLAQRGLHKLEPAYATLLAASAICPQSLPVIEGAAELAYSLHKPEARQLLGRVLAARPGDATAHAMLGALEARAGDCTAAVEDYSAALTQVRQSAAALREYAGCLLVLDRNREAVEALTRLLSLEDRPGYRIALARALNDGGQRGDALATLEPLLTPESKQSEALLLAAQMAEADGKTPQAVAWLRQAIQIAPKAVEAYVYFAEVSFNHGSFQVGIDLVNLGLKEVPGSARLLLARGVLEVQMALLDQALSDFEQAHRLDPQLSFADDALGMLFSQKHDASSALAWFEEKSKQQPADPLLQYLYAEALSESAATDEQASAKAIAAARRALADEPAYRPAQDLLCLLLQRAGDLKGVIEQANEATRMDPYDESALYQALLASQKLKRPEQTQALVQRLREAKAHNQSGQTRYMLQEERAADADQDKGPQP